MSEDRLMVCNICKQKVKVRKMSGFGNPLPVRHERYYGSDPCHGFYVSGQLVKEDEKLCPYCGATPYAAGCQNCPPCNR